MERLEHCDYSILMFHNERDFQQACERMGIPKVQITPAAERRLDWDGVSMERRR